MSIRSVGVDEKNKIVHSYNAQWMKRTKRPWVRVMMHIRISELRLYMYVAELFDMCMQEYPAERY